MRPEGGILRPEHLAICFALIAVALLYTPGLGGPFLFDDHNTLRPLGNWGSIDSFEKLRLFIMSGFTGPTGRPISLLTFFLNSNTWPAEPFPFILTNILIHVLNGALVFLLIIKISSCSSNKQEFKAVPVALLAATLWALHPFHTSSVLYIVQRMTLLSATFSLMTILAYLEARGALLNNQNKKALAILFGCFILAVLALFSKENAVVIPLQLLILETYLSVLDKKSAKMHKLLIWGALIPASALVIGYPLKTLIVHIIDYCAIGKEQTYGRNFTMIERFWTQQRVLGDYIVSIVLPKMQTSGVFHDNYTVSRSIFDPITTFFWFIFHISVLAFSFLFKKQLPWMFLGVFWFYGSHVIESTFVMLELKFEHRNYLPSLGLIFVITNLILVVRSKMLRWGLISLSVLIYSLFLFMSSSLWGTPLKASMVWAAENPNSSRASEHAAHMALTYGADEQKAMEFARRGVALSGEPTPELRFILAFCKTYNDKPPDWSGIAERIKHEQRDWSLYPVLKELLYDAVANKCGMLNLTAYRELLAAYRDNNAYDGNLSVLVMDELEIHSALHFGEKALAIELEKSRNELTLPLAYKMNRALIFASYNELRFAANMLDIGIQVAEQLGNESEFTLKSAKEMLALMRADAEKETR